MPTMNACIGADPSAMFVPTKSCMTTCFGRLPAATQGKREARHHPGLPQRCHCCRSHAEALDRSTPHTALVFGAQNRPPPSPMIPSPNAMTAYEVTGDNCVMNSTSAAPCTRSPIVARDARADVVREEPAQRSHHRTHKGERNKKKRSGQGVVSPHTLKVEY